MASQTSTASLRLAEFIVKSRWEDVPLAAVDAAKRAVLDTIGVMLAGVGEPAAQIVRRLAEVEGGTPLCSVLGTPLRTGAIWAALANGVAAHALDFDDTNFTMMGHPSAPVLAAALAAGEAAMVDGRRLLLAFLIGFETEVAFGEALNPAHYERGWHATGTLGTLGAVAAAARLLDLDVPATTAALGVAASQASGLKENFGTMTKPFHAGHAARSGVLSALLAREGFTSSHAAVDGVQGLLALYGGGDAGAPANATPSITLDHLGSPWQILRTGIAVKPYPCCALTHSAIDALLELRATHRIEPAEVRAVEVAVAPVVPTVLIHPDPSTELEAKFSMQYCAAAALATGRIAIDTFEPATLADPEIRKLMVRARMVVDPAVGGSRDTQAWSRVRVTLADGRVLGTPPRGARGHPDAPLSDDALARKFSDCAARALPPDRIASVTEMLRTLDGCPDLRSLTALLRG
jgi:2-methylcitrate dehydratase PrpD